MKEKKSNKLRGKDLILGKGKIRNGDDTKLRKITLFIEKGQRDYLDDGTYLMNKNTGKPINSEDGISKSKLIRALIDIAREKDIDFSKLESIEQFKNAVILDK